MLRRRLSVLWLVCIALCGVANFARAAPAAEAEPEPDKAQTPKKQAWVEHIVQPGDNPWRLMLRQLRGPQYVLPLMTANGIVDPLRIQPGTRLRMRPEWLKLQPLKAEVSYVRGLVSWRASEHQSYQRAEVGLRLGSGAWLQTPADGQCTLVFGAGTRSVLRPDSEVQLVEASGTALGARGPLQLRLKVLRGGVDSEVDPTRSGGRFDILTPSGVATVRGTAFRVDADADQTRTAVDRGAVQVGNAAGRRQVPQGFGSAVARGQAPQAPRPLLAAPDLSAVPEELSRFPTPLALPEVPDAHGLQVEWLLKGNPQAVVAEAEPREPGLSGEGVEDGDHVLRVRHVDAEHFAGLAAERPVRVLRRPDPPIYQSPAPGSSLTDTRPALAWGRGDPTEVHLQVAAQADFSSPLVDTRLENSGEARVPTSLDSGRWYWRLSAIDARGVEGPWGEVQTFDLLPEPPQGPAAMSAQGQGRDLRQVLRWSKVPGSSGYEISLQPEGRPAGDSELVLQADESATLVLPPEVESGDYLLKVRALRSDGLRSPWGAPQKVRVPSLWNPWILVPLLVPLLLW